MMDTYQAGDICKYSFGNKNRSVAIVEIVRLLVIQEVLRRFVFWMS